MSALLTRGRHCLPVIFWRLPGIVQSMERLHVFSVDFAWLELSYFTNQRSLLGNIAETVVQMQREQTTGSIIDALTELLIQADGYGIHYFIQLEVPQGNNKAKVIKRIQKLGFTEEIGKTGRYCIPDEHQRKTFRRQVRKQEILQITERQGLGNGGKKEMQKK